MGIGGKNLMIEHLDLSCNLLTNTSCDHICALLNPELDVKSISLGKNLGIDLEGFKTVVKACRKSAKIANLDF